MTDDKVTITISVNVCAADKWEGDAEEYIIVPANFIKHLDPTKFNEVIEKLVTQAVAEYKKVNE